MKRIVASGILILALLAAADVAAQTSENPRLLGDIWPGTTGSYYNNPLGAVMDGTLYLSLASPNEGREFWKTDFTTATLIRDIRTGSAAGSGALHSNGSMLLMCASGDGGEGWELWKSDGTANGTNLLVDIFPGSNHSSPGAFVTLNGITYFSAANALQQYNPGGNVKFQIPYAQMYRSDGTANGTFMVKDFGTSRYGCGGLAWSTAVNDLLYFGVHQANNTAPGFTGSHSGLARSDGTTNGSFILVSTSEAGERSTPGEGRTYFKGLGELVLFTHQNSTYGIELWRTDGTVSGTSLLKDINPGSTSSRPSFLIPMGGYMYFTADDGVHGMELWRSDGSATGTVMVADILTGSGSSSPQWLTAVGDVLYFTASGGAEGRQLWKYDPSEPVPLERVAVINPNGDCEPLYSNSHPEWSGGFSPDYPDGMFAVYHGNDGPLFYFIANDGALGFELWQSDGTAVDTRLVKDVCVDCTATRIQYVTNFLDRIWFVQDDGIHGHEPWVLDPAALLDYVYNRPPVVSLAASTVEGEAELEVTFTATASDPDGTIEWYAWDFGDGNTNGGAALAGVTHTYVDVGIYTASVTVTDNDGAHMTVSVTITATSGTPFAYVEAQTVTRVSKPGGRWAGKDVIVVKDENHAPLSGAVVTASYSGPNSGTLSGTTGTNGSVTLETPAVKSPSVSWCFTVTDIQASGKTFDSNLGEPSACEGTSPKHAAEPPLSFVLEQNYPNPFTTTTGIVFSIPLEGRVRLAVYDLLGREVRTVMDSWMPAGTHSARFDARELPAGSYYLQLDALGARQMRVMMFQP